MFQLKLTAKARRELKNISHRHKLAIANIFDEIKENPSIGKPLMRELTGRNSYKVGVYRIIYKVNKKDKIVIIITAGHRATVYK
jgi:mRNA interferase RelE/StbE